MTEWKCQNCGETISEEKLENIIEKGVGIGSEFDQDIEDVDEVILVDCRSCEEEIATYKKNDTTESQDSATNTTTRSKMLQAARS